MAAPSFTLTNQARLWLADGTFDLDANTFKVAAFTSIATPTAAATQLYGDISANEVANGNGYLTGGTALVAPTWTKSGAVATFDATDTIFTASGAGLTGLRWFGIYAVGTLNGHINPLLGFGLFDSAPADVAVAAGNSLTLVWNAGGIFTLS